MLEMDWQASVQDARGEDMPQVVGVGVVSLSCCWEVLIVVVFAFVFVRGAWCRWVARSPSVAVGKRGRNAEPLRH
jgi:hypothetical protein